MQVIKADHAGACYGVQRALNLAYQAAAHTTKVQTLGPLIHNPQVVLDLALAGVGQAQSIEEASGDALIIRSHGVTPATLRKAQAAGFELINATCPFVTRAHKAAALLAKRYGVLIILGEEGHPEVEGIRAWAEEAGAQVYVVLDPEDLPASLPSSLGVVVQTTQTNARLEVLMQAMAERGITVELKNTICSATTERQEAAAELAQRVDAFVVVGGKNSSNTTRLYEICLELCPYVIHIEEVGELHNYDFSHCSCIGLTAGASTPAQYIDEVYDYLSSLTPAALAHQ